MTRTNIYTVNEVLSGDIIVPKLVKGDDLSKYNNFIFYEEMGTFCIDYSTYDEDDDDFDVRDILWVRIKNKKVYIGEFRGRFKVQNPQLADLCLSLMDLTDVEEIYKTLLIIDNYVKKQVAKYYESIAEIFSRSITKLPNKK